MANLHFHYGVMSASKSATLIITAYNFTKNDIVVECIKPKMDNRFSTDKIDSRLGIETPALVLPNLANYAPQPATRVILIDEVHFFKPADIDTLVNIADNGRGIVVMCYGLMVDSNGELFPAAKRLVEVGAKLHQLEASCQIKGCMNKATHHLRFDADGNVIRKGEQFAVGDSIYKSVCRHHFNQFYQRG